MHQKLCVESFQRKRKKKHFVCIKQCIYWNSPLYTPMDTSVPFHMWIFVCIYISADHIWHDTDIFLIKIWSAHFFFADLLYSNKFTTRLRKHIALPKLVSSPAWFISSPQLFPWIQYCRHNLMQTQFMT